MKNVKHRSLSTVFLDELTADVTFVCGPEDCANPVNVPAHKLVLALLSPVFKTMFYGSLPEKPTIRLTDATGDGFKEFLQIFYKEDFVASIENAFEVFYLIKKYELNEFLNIYSHLLQRNLTIENVCHGLETATYFELSGLRKFCRSEIIKNHRTFFASEEFVNCSPKVLCTILELDGFKLYGEEVFRGCYRWARNALKNDHDTEYEPTLPEIRAKMDDVFHLIEFGAMKCRTITMILCEFNGFFTKKDMDLISTILTAKFPIDFNGSSAIDCSLTQTASSPFESDYIDKDNVISFQCTKTVFLVGYKHTQIIQRGWETENSLWLTLVKKSSDRDKVADIVLLRNKLNVCIKFKGKSDVEAKFDAIMIEPNITYEIQVKCLSYEVEKYVTDCLFESNVCDLGFDGKVTIEGTETIISSLQFNF